MEFQVTLYLDKRREKDGHLYPVKIRVWNTLTRQAKLYRTKLDLTEKEFKSAWESEKPRKEFRELHDKLESLIQKAKESGKDMSEFTFDELERKLYRRKGDGINILFHYEQVINQFKQRGQIGTASNYDLSKKSLLKFIESKKRKIPQKITFYEITSDWLKDYEYYMVKDQDKSLTTVSMYLRALRAIFNKAIEENEIKIDNYPFGKRKYQVPASHNVKKALTKTELKKLFKAKPKTEEQAKAKDFWFFSYFCNGMNIKDISLLKYSDIEEDTIKFYRAKTFNTSKGNLRPIVTYLNEFTKNVISKYGMKKSTYDSYIFNVLKPGVTPTEEKKLIQNFTRFINQHMEKICEANKLPVVSTYWARHSFTTNSIRNGASMEFIQESLGHGNIKTTMNYFAGFEDETKKEFAKKLMDF